MSITKRDRKRVFLGQTQPTPTQASPNEPNLNRTPNLKKLHKIPKCRVYSSSKSRVQEDFTLCARYLWFSSSPPFMFGYDVDRTESLEGGSFGFRILSPILSFLVFSDLAST